MCCVQHFLWSRGGTDVTHERVADARTCAARERERVDAAHFEWTVVWWLLQASARHDLHKLGESPWTRQCTVRPQSQMPSFPYRQSRSAIHGSEQLGARGVHDGIGCRGVSERRCTRR